MSDGGGRAMAISSCDGGVDEPTSACDAGSCIDLYHDDPFGLPSTTATYLVAGCAD
jgi:hypothetical protein